MEDCKAALRELTSRLKRLVKCQRQNDYEICVALHAVWKRELWRGQYKSFRQYGEVVCGFGQDTTYKYSQLIEQGFTREQFVRVGMSKLIRCMGVKFGPKRDALLAVAHTMNRAQLFQRAQELRGVCVDQTPPAKLLLLGEVAASIMRLADTMGCTPERYVELMVTGMVSRRGKRAA